MLKISTVDLRAERRLVVEGQLVAPWVGELRAASVAAKEALGERRLVIDLSGTTVIGQDGQDLIFELMQEGAKFSCGGVLTRYVLKQLASRCRRGHGGVEPETSHCF